MNEQMKKSNEINADISNGINGYDTTVYVDSLDEPVYFSMRPFEVINVVKSEKLRSDICLRTRYTKEEKNLRRYQSFNDGIFDWKFLVNFANKYGTERDVDFISRQIPSDTNVFYCYGMATEKMPVLESRCETSFQSSYVGVVKCPYRQIDFQIVDCTNQTLCYNNGNSEY